MCDGKALSACKIINLCPCCSRWSLRCQKIIIISSPFAWFVNWRKWCRRRQTTWFDHTRLSSFCHQPLSCWHHHCLQNHAIVSLFQSLSFFDIIIVFKIMLDVVSLFCYQSLSFWHHNCLPNHSMMSSFCYQSFTRWHHHWSFCQHIVLHVVIPIACCLKSR